MNQQTVFDADLIRRYDKAGPRYTSYPTAVQFHEGFDEKAYRACAARSNASDRPLSLYFHIPFCDTVCFYCACNKLATKDRSLNEPYLAHIYKELALQSELFDRERQVDQLHWGGGTPTFLGHTLMRELMRKTAEYFKLRTDDRGEYSIEVDPRETKEDTIALLRELGFNRLSLGVQDFDPRVQKAVNRIQPESQTLAAMDAARQENFVSISLDLIYGLPFQSMESFSRTLDKVIAANPDRISVFNYAHLPHLFKPQRRINAEELPSPAEKLRILQQTITQLTEAGYVYIGMDHFAKPGDELTVAQRNGTLYRNFQGYATHADCDLIGLGSTSIAKVADSYSQNVKNLDDYYARIDAGRLGVFRGVELSADDILRRDVITRLICHFYLDIQEMERQYSLHFIEHFAPEWKELETMQADGLLIRDEHHIEVLPAGKLLIRNICMVFDAYLREKNTRQQFSKVI
ncbi:MAG: oxygen-independent coproporphyrinogen III oxidase [Gammaproteobacteria bacterium]|nr:oxygen-independent coproporphyrinogen III oxidase [Gammaproteobacteria bacterium]